MNTSDAVVGGVTGREPGGRGAEEDALFVEFRRTGSRRCATSSSSATWGWPPTWPAGSAVAAPATTTCARWRCWPSSRPSTASTRRNVAFSTFAGRTIEGEIKRHFRDTHGRCACRVRPRRLHLQLRRATDELTQRLGRSPTVPQLAEHLGIETDDVIEGIAAGSAYSTASLDAPPATTASGTRQSAARTPGSATSPTSRWSRPAGPAAPREREIVRLRFYEELSQSEIAERIGISQMHVSRLLRRSFEQMRGHGGDDVDE